ncbi:hypothetical protein TNCV_1103261 [Trichonephila clavipes]|nr:hypothetical protein TNCV_1103261 [Trichonephila clavipes]
MLGELSQGVICFMKVNDRTTNDILLSLRFEVLDLLFYNPNLWPNSDWSLEVHTSPAIKQCEMVGKTGCTIGSVSTGLELMTPRP